MLRLAQRLAEAALRRALGYEVEVEEWLCEQAEKLAALVAECSVSCTCRLCGRGPFTRKGLYIHVKTVHWDQLVSIAYEHLYKARAGAAKR